MIPRRNHFATLLIALSTIAAAGPHAAALFPELPSGTILFLGPAPNPEKPKAASGEAKDAENDKNRPAGTSADTVDPRDSSPPE